MRRLRPTPNTLLLSAALALGGFAGETAAAPQASTRVASAGPGVSTASTASAGSAGTTAQAAFDAAYLQLTGPQSLDAGAAQTDADLARLRALLPAGDRLREVRLRAVSCINLPWKEPAEALAYAADAARRAQELADAAAQARALICRAYFLTLGNDSTRALAELDAVLKLVEPLAAERQLLAEALTIRGGIRSNLGEQALALQDLQRARSEFRAAGLTQDFDALLLRMASAYARIGDWQQAERELLALIERMQARRFWDGLVAGLVQLGTLYNDSGAPAKAASVFERATQLAEEHDNRFGLNRARMGLARSQIARGQAGAALATLEQARAGFDALDDATQGNLLLLLSGQALAGSGQHRLALDRYRQALPLIRQDGNQRHLAQLYEAKASSEEALGNAAQALADYRRYTALQMELQRKMRVEQNRLLAYESEVRQRELENRQLRDQAEARHQQLQALESVRRWQNLALALGGLLLLLASSLAWRQWRQSRALRALAMTDPLTGVSSRRAIEAMADHEIGRAAAQRLSLLVLDLDHFKAVNDRWGHAAGDAVLQAATRLWQSQLRSADRLGRIGGEEFVVTCPDTGLAQAQAIAQRLLEATRSLRLPQIDPSLRVSTSNGLAQALPGESREALIARADAALYRAKQGGRDRVELATEAAAAPAGVPAAGLETRAAPPPRAAA